MTLGILRVRVHQVYIFDVFGNIANQLVISHLGIAPGSFTLIAKRGILRCHRNYDGQNSGRSGESRISSENIAGLVN